VVCGFWAISARERLFWSEAKTAPSETSQNKTTYQLRKGLFLIVYLKVNNLCLIETTVSVYGPSIVELLGIRAIFSQEREQSRLARGLARLRQSLFASFFFRLLRFLGDTCP
jgi:hypothetical protein